jgi:demethylmenaquinone methyltransferase/2-methoxy-6-polyprenyl-1,4-benzoquinol methylase
VAETPQSVSEGGYGLKEDWDSIQKTLEEIIPVYDKTNRYISLGTDLRIRKRGIELLLKEIGVHDFLILDLGCGTGKMSQLFGAATGSTERIILVDPIKEMMRVAKSRNKTEGLLAVYENLAFPSESIDAAMAGFSLRDARDLVGALRELNRILKPKGVFLMVDLAKPDSKVKSGLISVYWRLLAPFLAFVGSGRAGLKFGALSKTYQRLPKVSELIQLFERNNFTVSKMEFSMLGGVCIFVFRKKG